MEAASNWLNVQTDEPVPLSSMASCMTLCDIKRDNYLRLIAVDFSYEEQQIKATLKLYRGTDLKEEYELPGIPAAVQSLYVDEHEPKTPILAVAIAESILFYRHMKPYFKYTVPELEPEELEKDIWRKLPVVRVENQSLLIENLKTIDRPKLSRKSQKLLLLPLEERNDFIIKHAESTLSRYSSIVAMHCLQRVSCEVNPPSYLVLATDNGDILILEPQSFGVLYRAKTCAQDTTPSLLAVHGTYETDFCIVIATRFGGLYLLRKSAVEGQEIIKLTHPISGITLLPIDQTIVVCTMDKRLTCYSKKGKQLYVLPLSDIPNCMTTVSLSHIGMTLVCVALQGGLVQFYMQRQLVDEFEVESTVTSMLWGHMGYEDCVLTLITEQGLMLLKILRRLATFEPQKMAKLKSGNVAVGSSKENYLLDKPKKSTMFIEQTEREKQNAKATYGSFQVELWRLRHTAARATVDAINSSESTISGDITHAPVKLSAEVCGAGPTFRLYLTLQNLSSYKMASNLSVLLHADRRHYNIPKSTAKLPSILPGIPLKIDFEITAILDPNDKLPPPTLTPDNAIIRVMLLKLNQAKPLIAAVIAMPQSEANF